MSDVTRLRALPLGSATARTTPAVTLTPLPIGARFILRAPPAAQEAAVRPLGLRLPVVAHQSETVGQWSALWLGPDEWLLMAPEVDGPVLRTALAASIGSLPHSLVDIGHRQSGMIVSGPVATAVLNTGCPLDLSLDEFPVGKCTRTMLGKAEIVLWRQGETRFHVEAWRSFLPYIWRYLDQAAKEYISA